MPQEDVMVSQLDRLPSRFPVGTRYVVEGRAGAHGQLSISLRYLQFPDGRQVTLPAEQAARMGSRRQRPGRRATGRK
jgi:hypothetical protein